MDEREPGDHFEHDQRPTTNHPAGGERRPVWVPLIATIVFVAVLVVGYLLATELLINAD